MNWYDIESRRNREGIQKRRRHISKKEQKTEKPTYPTWEENRKEHDGLNNVM